MRRVFATLLLVGASVLAFFAIMGYEAGVSNPSGPVVQSSLQEISDQVASDAVTQYGITARSGNLMDRCVQAGMVAAAFLQAKRESEYGNWKIKEQMDCANAGIRP